jgi:hypothetical protein
VAKDNKWLIALSNCEHKKYAIADIFTLEDFANSQGVREPQVGNHCSTVTVKDGGYSYWYTRHSAQADHFIIFGDASGNFAGWLALCLQIGFII